MIKMEKVNRNEYNKAESRKKRGQIVSDDLKPFIDYNFNELVAMLSDETPQKRTIAATLLNNNFIGDIDDSAKDSVISELAKSFKEENALYSRIAISDSLASFGELAVPYLIKLLGKIGNNQEKELPKKYFNKKSFPLPRDLAGRTLAKIGDVSTPFLINVINEKYSSFVKEQALDVIGAIAYKYDDHRAIYSIKNLLASIDDISPFITWKIARSLSGFKNNMDALNLVIDILNNYNDYVEIQWECIRSIGQIRIVNDNVIDILDNFTCENNHENNPQIELALKVSKDFLGI